MKKVERVINIAGSAIFGTLGMTALVVAAFFGAGHQLALALICFVVACVLGAEALHADRKGKVVNPKI